MKTTVRQQQAALPTEPAVDASEIAEPPAKMRRIDDFDDEVHDEPTTDEMTRYHHCTVSSSFPGILPWWKDNQRQRAGRESPDQKYSTSQSVRGESGVAMAMAEASRHHETQDRKREMFYRQGRCCPVPAPTAAMYVFYLAESIYITNHS